MTILQTNFRILLTLMVLCGSFAQAVFAQVNVIPLPQKIKVLDGQLTLTSTTSIQYKTVKGRNAVKDGGYTLTVKPDGITVVSSGDAGRFYADQTIQQLFAESKTINCVEINDEPRFVWRGLLLDLARHFFDKEQIKRLIDRMAVYKLNMLHLHLTDHQGWRIEIKKYPKLIEIGSIGEHGNPKAPSRYLTQADFKELIDYAAKKHITIVPEIEMPGHYGAALRSYPELLACDPNHPAGMCCPGKESTLRFTEGVLDEVCELFPSKFIHIGGDECSKSEWKKCPDCKKRMEENGLKDYDELQSWFIKHFDKYLAAKGKRLIGWDEILDGGLAPEATVMSWRGTVHGVEANRGGLAAAKAGHDVVFTPVDYCYIDAPQFADSTGKKVEDGYRYIGYPPLTNEKIYGYEPTVGFSAKEAEHIMGVQANLWTEFVSGTEPDMEWRIFPRLLTLAEIAWTLPKEKNYKQFKKRLEVHRERLVKAGINAAPIDLKK